MGTFALLAALICGEPSPPIGTKIQALSPPSLSSSSLKQANAPQRNIVDLLEHPSSDPLLTKIRSAAPGSRWQVPFVVILCIPSKDRRIVDITRADIFAKEWSKHDVGSTVEHAIRVVAAKKWMWEQATRFRGYANPAAPSSISPYCTNFFVRYTGMEMGKPDEAAKGRFFPDYPRMIEEVNGKDLVDNKGVKEFWFIQLPDSRITAVESNLSNKAIGSVSNGGWLVPLPIYSRSYLAYHIALGKTINLHNEGHQMEFFLSHFSTAQDGNDHLFTRQFVGADASGTFMKGRAGNCHRPPNSAKDYDYKNTTPVLSDIEDWNPMSTGVKKPVSALTWEAYEYPGLKDFRTAGSADVIQDDALWYIYWFQNFPGLDNSIKHPKGTMTNWWRFVGDLDGAIKEKQGLWKPSK